jgi:S-adenosylmethionine synthetase
MLDPVRVLVNGRAAETCAGRKIPLWDLFTDTIETFFAHRVPDLAGNLRIEMNVTANASPGAVEINDDVPERSVWFAPRSLDDLRERRVVLSNDTSLGTGWAPEHPFEVFVRDLSDALSAPHGLPGEHPWWGSDVKVMGYAAGDEIDLVACVPQKSTHVPDRAAYLTNRDLVTAHCRRLVAERFRRGGRVRVSLHDCPSGTSCT